MKPWPDTDAWKRDLRNRLDARGEIEVELMSHGISRSAATDDQVRQAAELIANGTDHALALPPRFRTADPSQIDDGLGAAFEALFDRDGFKRGALVLAGPVGVGKSHTAAALLRHCAIIERGGSPLAFLPVAMLLRRLQPGGDLRLEDVLNVRHLVLDDLGAHRPTEWATEQLEALIDHRWANDLPTIATTNLDRAGLRRSIGERAHSRLMHDAVALQITGADRRSAA